MLPRLIAQSISIFIFKMFYYAALVMPSKINFYMCICLVKNTGFVQIWHVIIIKNTQLHTYFSVYFVLITCFKNSLGWRKAYWVKNLGSVTFVIPSSTDSTIWSLLASCWMVASVELYTACVRSLLSVYKFSFEINNVISIWVVKQYIIKIHQ